MCPPLRLHLSSHSFETAETQLVLCGHGLESRPIIDQGTWEARPPALATQLYTSPQWPGSSPFCDNCRVLDFIEHTLDCMAVNCRMLRGSGFESACQGKMAFCGSRQLFGLRIVTPSAVLTKECARAHLVTSSAQCTLLAARSREVELALSLAMRVVQGKKLAVYLGAMKNVRID